MTARRKFILFLQQRVKAPHGLQICLSAVIVAMLVKLATTGHVLLAGFWTSILVVLPVIIALDSQSDGKISTKEPVNNKPSKKRAARDFWNRYRTYPRWSLVVLTLALPFVVLELVGILAFPY